MKFSFISLGCAKNLVDSEYILGLLRQGQIEILDDISESDAIFINTCGFIDDAKKEAINTILDVAANKKQNAKLVVIGCLAKRYKEDLYKSIPEIDLIVGVDEYDTIGDKLNKLFNISLPKTFDPLKRSLTNPLPVSYLKIGEGCSNKCAYCAIPLIRGDYYSYPKELIIEDAKRLISLGKKEITVIAQDPTRYGKDLYDDNYGIEELLDELAKLDRSVNFYVLYLYPDRITNKLIDVIASNDNIVNYFDIPIQHSSNKMLSLMGRSGTKEKYIDVIAKIRKKIPGAILRTTLITGFPGETRKDFKDLVDFVKLIKFDNLGCFTFSDEADTKANTMDHKVSHLIASIRKARIMKIQRKISLAKNISRVGQVHRVIIENYDGINYIGRSYLQACDAGDGNFIVKSNKELIIGEYYNVEIVKALPYDVIGIVKEN